MTEKSMRVKRVRTVPGLGIKFLDETVKVKQASDEDEIEQLFHPSDKELAKLRAAKPDVDVNDLRSTFAWDAIREVCNVAHVAAKRSEVISTAGGGDDALTRIKGAVNGMKLLYKNKTEAEIAKIILTPDMRQELTQEGFLFGDPDVLKKQHGLEEAA